MDEPSSKKKSVEIKVTILSYYNPLYVLYRRVKV